jgi:hypothetical protein
MKSEMPGSNEPFLEPSDAQLRDICKTLTAIPRREDDLAVQLNYIADMTGASAPQAPEVERSRLSAFRYGTR